jgi:hypothetical protein
MLSSGTVHYLKIYWTQFRRYRFTSGRPMIMIHKAEGPNPRSKTWPRRKGADIHPSDRQCDQRQQTCAAGHTSGDWPVCRIRGGLTPFTSSTTTTTTFLPLCRFLPLLTFGFNVEHMKGGGTGDSKLRCLMCDWCYLLFPKAFYVRNVTVGTTSETMKYSVEIG